MCPPVVSRSQEKLTSISVAGGAVWGLEGWGGQQPDPGLVRARQRGHREHLHREKMLILCTRTLGATKINAGLVGHVTCPVLPLPALKCPATKANPLSTPTPTPYCGPSWNGA